MSGAGRDPGLQAERTALTWQRTGVASVLAAGGAVLAAVHHGRPFVLAASLAALALSAGTAVPPRDGTPPYGRLLRAGVATAALAAVGVLLAVS